MTILTQAPDTRTLRTESDQVVHSARATLAQLTAAKAALEEQQRTVLEVALASLKRVGVEAIVMTRTRLERTRIAVGETIYVQETIEHSEADGQVRASRRVDMFRGEHPSAWVRFTAQTKPYLQTSLHIIRGSFTVAIVDGDTLLAVSKSDVDSEVGHRRSLSSLRRLARRDGIRVQARDQEITLVDLSGNSVLHRGDTVSAFAWLLNIDTAIAVTNQNPTGNAVPATAEA